MADVSKKFVEFFFSVESVALVESRVIITDVFPYFLVEVVSQGRNQDDNAANKSETSDNFAHYYVSIPFTLDRVDIY